jgi:CTP synthase
MRQFQFRVGPENFALIYVSLIPVVGGEQKTKPTQAGVRDLRGLGLLPDLVRQLTSTVYRSADFQIACRCEEPLLAATMQKVSMFCHVTPKQVMGVHNVSSTYHVPLLMQDQGLIDFLTKKLDLASVSITKELKQTGQDLSVRWKALTSG